MRCGRVPSLTNPAYSRSDPTLTDARREKNRGGSARIELRSLPVRTGASTLARLTTWRDASRSSRREALVSVRFRAARSSRMRATAYLLDQTRIQPALHPLAHLHLGFIPDHHAVERHARTNVRTGRLPCRHQTPSQQAVIVSVTSIVPPIQFPSTPNGRYSPTATSSAADPSRSPNAQQMADSIDP